MLAKFCSRFWIAERNELHYLAYFSIVFRVKSLPFMLGTARHVGEFLFEAITEALTEVAYD